MLYAVIILLWVCVLLPIWLRRHDEALESRSADRFASAMRTLSRRPAEAREVAMPARTGEPIHADAGTERAIADGRALLAARRRRSLGVLGGLTAGVLGLALLGVVPGWAVALPGLALAGFVVHLRRETKAQAARDRRRRARPRAARLPLSSAPRAAARSAADAGASLLPAAAIAATVPEPQQFEAVEEPYDSELDRVWEPVAVPLPTYVTAPKAPRSVRVIDLTHPGLWTSGHLDAAEAQELVARELAALDEDRAAEDGADVRLEPAAGDGIVTGAVVIERRRAANG